MLIKPGNRIQPEENPIDTYRLHIKSMCGDADYYLYEKRDFDHGEEGVKALEDTVRLLYSIWEKLSYNAACDGDNVEQIIEETGKELGIEFPTDIVLGLLGYDDSYQQWASLETVKVTYFGPHGTEYMTHFLLEDHTTKQTLSRFNSMSCNQKLVDWE